MAPVEITQEFNEAPKDLENDRVAKRIRDFWTYIKFQSQIKLLKLNTGYSWS